MEIGESPMKICGVFLIWLWDQLVDPILQSFGFEASEILSISNLSDHQNKTSKFSQCRQLNKSKASDTEMLTAYLELMKQYPNITSSASSTGPSEARFKGSRTNACPSFPRIHWIGVDHLSSFPFHATGYGSQEKYYELRDILLRFNASGPSICETEASDAGASLLCFAACSNAKSTGSFRSSGCGKRS